MTRRHWIWALGFACLVGGPADAAPTTFAWSGTVTANNAYVGRPVIGTPVFGSFTIDPDNANGVQDTCFTGFLECWTYDGISLEWNGVPLSGSVRVRIWNNSPGTGPDWYQVYFSGSGLGYSILEIFLQFKDTTGTAFEAASNPLVPSLAAYDSATFSFAPFCWSSGCLTNPSYGGTIGALAITVRPSLATITPGAMYPNSTGNLTLTGTHFVPGATSVAVSGSGVTVTNVQVASSSELTATFTVAASAAAGSRNVTVTTSDGTSNAIAFTVGTLPPCSIAMNKTSYVNGDLVVAQVLQFGNPNDVGLAVEYKLWLTVPGAAPGVIARGGSDGSFVLPANFSKNLGPVALFTVTSGLARGTYSLNCRFLNPGTGDELVVGAGQFTLQ